MTSPNGVMGTLYLIHLDPPYKHAGHYLGWTSCPERRFDQHKAGQGSRLLRFALAAGCKLTVVWTRPGTRNDERRLKNMGSSHRHCDICRPEYLAARRAARKEKHNVEQGTG